MWWKGDKIAISTALNLLPTGTVCDADKLFSYIAEPQLLSYILYEQCNESVPSVHLQLTVLFFLNNEKYVGYNEH